MSLKESNSLKLHEYSYFVITIILSLLTCVFLASYIVELFTDEQLVSAMDLPSDKDSMGIPVAAGFILSLGLAGVQNLYV